MKVSGAGSTTNQGLTIIDFARTNDVALEFTSFYVTDKSVSFATLVDPADSTFSGMTEYELTEYLSSNDYYKGNIQQASPLSTEDASYLPLLMSIVSNAITRDMEINTLFLLANDANGNKISVVDSSGFSIGEEVTDLTTGAVGEVKYVDTTNNDIYVTLITLGLITLRGFEAGNIIQNAGATASETMITVGDAEYVIYKGCLKYDEVLDIQVADPSSFSAVAPNNYVSNIAGANGTIDDITLNDLRVTRLSAIPFLDTDYLDNVEVYVAAETQIRGVPYVNLSESTVLPVSYCADGSDLLFKVNIRSASGFPRVINVINTAVTEIEIHSGNDSSHEDLRYAWMQIMSHLGRDIRDLKGDIRDVNARIDNIVTANSLIE